MSWDYRLVKHDIGKHDDGLYSICEVYYDSSFNPIMRTMDPVVVADTRQGLIAEVERILEVANSMDVLLDSSIGATVEE
jgi:hypothetical protein